MMLPQTHHRNGVFSHPSRTLLWLFFVFFFGIQAKAQAVDTLIDVGGYKLHFNILKGNGTAILFESGGGLDASQWDFIAETLHHRLEATVITYDRAGFGESTLDTLNYSILEEIEGLEVGLTTLGYGDSEYFLVGHSLGAFYNWLLAARNPDQVKAIVFFDPRIPSSEDERFARDYFQTLDRKDFEEGGYLSLYHLLGKIEANSNCIGKYSLPQDVPILNVMAETGPFDSAKENLRFQAAQLEFVKAGENRRLVLAKGSSHNIPLDDRCLVIEHIEAFYKEQVY
ncbi:alpha/beta hydrolase [Algoriphagus sp. H41]|uniref:Alpha/beta hydrolase n=1 Tax=Algoriphagus oliviformis TaxID=2811231 RepID=A0ABS3C5L6_9BACT|nr:alpha/beta hydrolase [Algoriphagus oliviformis]MBN7811441.1 alpha/beta hydrolase [Algoriphagus oliviformis]